jgi:dienelactone hydrolase
MHSIRDRFLLFGLLLVAASARAQTGGSLPRRAYFGVGLEKAPTGARVFAVSPGSTAAEVGIVVGDVIEVVDDETISSPEAVVAAISRHRGGETVRIGILRSNDRRTIVATLKSLPIEQMSNAAFEYDSVVSAGGARLRTILSKPVGLPTRRYPAVLLIPGGGCGSIDTPLNPDLAQPGLMRAIGSKGFVTMRVEKSGVGDSEGMPCESIGFTEELAGYQAAFKALRSHPSVDPQQIYLLGISLGGVFAPLLAAETKVAGIAVYGTPGGPTSPYPGRSERFFQEFARVDVAAAWSKVGTRVQILHGEYDVDPAIDRRAHERIAEIVNKSGSGSAQFMELPGLDHCWSRHASLEASKDHCGQGEVTNALSEAILQFLSAGSAVR